MDDWQLLQEFVSTRSEEAFRRLVERHAGMVLASALRQAGDEQLAQDVAQAVFILLARKAGGLKRGTILAGWLFQTTRFVAARALRSEQRRQRREQEAFDMQPFTSTDEAWRRMAPVIDDALDRLDRADRDAILLRYIDGRSMREVATSLGVTEEAAKKRVSRAMERVREVMRRKGVMLSVTSLSQGLTANAQTGVSPAMAHQLAGAAWNSTAGSSAFGYATEVLRAWFWRKFARVACIGGIAVAGLTWVVMEWNEPPAATTAPLSSAANVFPVSTAPSEPEPIESDSNSTNRILQLRVVAADTGEAITNARVARNYVSNRQWLKRFDLVTDASGKCVVPFPSNSARLDVAVFAPGWATRSAGWPSEGVSVIPAEYTLRLERVSHAIGGRVQDEFKRPVAGVEIWFMGSDVGGSAHRERPRERFGFHSIPLTNTDAHGRWSLPFVPSANPGFQIEAKHPDFADTYVISTGPQQLLSDIESEELRQLWAGELVTTMNPAFTLTGQIVDEQQQPIAGAKVQQREQGEIFATDAHGTFRVPKLKPGPWNFTVTANGFAPFRTNATIGPKMPQVVVTVQTGAVLRLRVVDEFDAEVEGATVGMQRWGPNQLTFDWRVKTDRDGRIEWLSAPRDVDLELFAWSDEHCSTREVRVKADGTEHLIRLRRKLDVYGRVVDAETGRGIRALKAMPAYGGPERYSYDSGLRWMGGETVRGTNGLFKLTFVENHLPWQVKVMADGYEDWISPSLTNFMEVVLDIAMRKSTLAESVHGVVLQPNGEPAVGAQVALLTFEHNVRLRKRAFEGDNRWMLQTDGSGAFQFTANRQAHSVAAVNRDGYALLRLPPEREPVTLRLQPWGRVEVIVDERARAQPVETIELYDPAADNYQGRVSMLGSYSVKADAQGRFIFEHVPAGECNVFINSGVGITYHHGTALVVRPGETTTVTIRERAGTLVKGKLTPVPHLSAPGDHPGDHVVLHFNPDPIIPAPFQDVPPEERPRKEFEFWSSPAGRERINSRRQTYTARFYPDGSFVSLERIPAGNYRLGAVFKNTSASRKVLVTEEQDVIDLGEIQLR